MLHKLSVIGLSATLCTAFAVRADDLGKSRFYFSGFGTLGAAHSSEDKADFTSSVLKPNGAGHTRSWSFDVDSRLGGQVDANLTQQLSAVLQLVAEQRYDNSYKPTVEWANLKYQFTPDVSARIGRIALPGLLTGDYRKVGYALPWVRPPGDVYRLAPITSSDGVDASWRVGFGRYTNTLQAYYGEKDVKNSVSLGGGTTEARQAFGFANTVDRGPATVRLSYHQGRLTIPTVRPFFDAFRQFGPRGGEIADRYGSDDKTYRMVMLGANYDPGAWFATGEWTNLATNSWFGDRAAWYVSGGHRFEQFTPYLIYSQIKVTSNTSDPGLSTAGLPPLAARTAIILNAGLNRLLASGSVQKTVAVGGRWDFMKNAAFKLQYEHIDIGTGSPGPLLYTQPGFVPGGKAHVFSAVLDFVF